MKFRKLRITWSVFLGVACVLLVLLRVRSYKWQDICEWQAYKYHHIGVISNLGQLQLAASDDSEWQIDQPYLNLQSKDEPFFELDMRTGVRSQTSPFPALYANFPH